MGAGSLGYRLQSYTWSDGNFESKTLPSHDGLSGLSLRWSGQYDTGTGTIVRHREGYLTQLINTLTIRRGSTTYARIRGMDIPWIHQFLQKEPHGFTQVTSTGSQANSTTGSPVQFDLAIPVPPGADKALLEMAYASGTGLGPSGSTGYNIDNAYLNGQLNFTKKALPAMRIVQMASLNAKTGSQNYVDMPSDGQLFAILYAIRANGTPYAVRDPTDALVQLRVEGEQKLEIAHLDAKEDYKNWCNLPTVQAGVGLIMPDDFPTIGPSSNIIFDLDGTSSDVNIYGVYTDGGGMVRTRETASDVLSASNVSTEKRQGGTKSTGRRFAGRTVGGKFKIPKLKFGRK